MIIISRPDDWSLLWGSNHKFYVWGHNHRGQLGGVQGSKVKSPIINDIIAALRPVSVVGGEQTLFILTAEGRVRNCLKMLLNSVISFIL